ncbi:UNVERIFIED_CONTAM: hypothetical protein GTU68_012176 [Idotea baltica]|nr:hypothetical protein [Idotea baltica]
MLVLSRKKNELIICRDDITITVVEIRGNKVRLGIEAPKELPVHRNEIYEMLLATNQAIVSNASGDGGMLVLSRERDESLVLGARGEIVITVVEIRGDKVRLGVDADKETVPVHRGEVYDAIQRERNRSGNDNPEPKPEALKVRVASSAMTTPAASKHVRWFSSRGVRERAAASVSS